MTAEPDTVVTARQQARRAARRMAPGFMANRARRYERTVRLREGVPNLARRLLAGSAAIVQAGPFAGMAYPAGRLPDIDAAVAKLLGTYEQEIAWVFERATSLQVSTFIDIGCADGYYAVGMAHASPQTMTYAYDLASSARRLCAEAAIASSVEDRVRIGRRFTLEALAAIGADDGLVLCDIEGGELELFDSAAAAALANMVVVIEVHEDERPGAGARVESVFASTHNAIQVRQQPRSEIPPALSRWPPEDQASALQEFRGPQLHWIVLEPKAHRRG